MQQGLYAYASKQADLEWSLSRKFSEMWALYHTAHDIQMEWPAAYLPSENIDIFMHID